MKITIERVFEDKDGYVAVAKESPFYPDGKGGQIGDRGRIGRAFVKKVIAKKDGIYHVIDGKIEPGEYEVSIDEERRKDIAQQHTAQHILSAAFLKVADINTVSFHMGEDFSTIDLDAAPILKEVIDEAEDLSNKVVMENRRVIEHVVDRDEAEKFNLRKEIPKNIKGKIRIIEVEGFDCNACGGFHVKFTGEIGLIKIIDYEKVKGSLTRVYFVAGMRALREFRKRVDLVKNLSAILTTSVAEMESRVRNLMKEIREKSSAVDKISEQYAESLKEKLLKNAEDLENGVKLVFYDGFESVGKYIFKFLGDEKGIVILVKAGGGYEIGSSSVNIKELVRFINDQIGSKGGGGAKRGRIMTDLSPNAVIEAIKEFIRKG